MAYDPNEVAKPKRTLLSQLSDEGGLGMKIARQGLTAPVQVLEAVAGLPGLLHGGIGFVNEAGNKALHLRNQDKTYEQLRDKAFERMARPMEVAANVLPFGKEAEEAMNDTIGWIFSHMQTKGAEYGDKNLEATGSPLMATIAHTSFEGLPYLGAEALGMKAAKGAVRMAKEGVLPRAADMVPSAKEFRSQLATPKPVQPEVIPPTRFLNSRHLDLPETSNFDKPRVTQENFKQSMREAFDIGDEHASAVQAVVEARARQWANETGYLPQDYYPMFFDEISQGGQHGPGALFQRDPEYAATWYSHLEKTIEGPKFPNKAPGEQMAKALESWASKGDIKPEELEWTGTVEWLRKQKGTVTKQQVLDHVRRNNVEIVEKQRPEEAHGEYTAAMDAIHEYNDTMEFKYGQRGGNRWQHYASEDELATYSQLKQTAEDMHKNRSKFHAYTMPERSGYREFLLRMPKNKSKEVPANINPPREMQTGDWMDEFGVYGDYSSAKRVYVYDDIPGCPAILEIDRKGHSVYQVDMPEQVNNGLNMEDGMFPGSDEMGSLDTSRTFNDIRDAKAFITDNVTDTYVGRTYNGPHWDESNVLAHSRTTDRVDAEGKKVLFIEENQSDWHQDGRKYGYDKGESTVEQSHELMKQYSHLSKQIDDLRTAMKEAEAYADMGTYYQLQDELTPLLEERDNVYAARERLHKRAPDAPFKKSWPMLVMKRMVRYAAEQGYDRLAWTTGKQQAARYNLSNYIDSLEWTKDSQGRYHLRTYDQGNLMLNNLENIQEHKLADYVGKDVAESIITGKAPKKMSGLDLEVGGEGMKAFYDQILPNEMNKFFGKSTWGGAKVGKTAINFTDKERAPRQFVGPEHNADTISAIMDKLEAGSPEWRRYYHVLSELNKGLSFDDASYPLLNHDAKRLGGTFEIRKLPDTEVHSIDITPEMRRKALSEGMPLFSKEGGRIKGSTEFLADGKAIIRAYQGADVKTALHEVGHVFRSEIEKTNPKLMEKIKKDFDAQDGWHVKAEEDFTEAFLKWLEKGERKNNFHENVFIRFKQWLVDTYKAFAGKAVVGDAVKDFFDKTIGIKELEKAEIEAKTIGGILDKYAPDDAVHAAYITNSGKPVGDIREGGHASTIENVTAEMGWHELFHNEDLGREETVRRTKLITRVALDGENLFVTGESVMTRGEARAAVKKYITDTKVSEAVVDYDGEQFVVKAGKFKEDKVKAAPKAKMPKPKFEKPTKDNPLNNTDSKTPLRDVIEKGKNIITDKQFLTITDNAIAKGNFDALARAGLVRGAQATRRNTINQAKKFAADLKAELPPNISHEYVALIDQLRDGIDPTFRSEKRDFSLRRTEEFLRKNPELMKGMPDKVLKLLRKKSIKDMNLEELYEVHNMIFNQENGLIKLGQLKYKLKKAKETRMVNDVVSALSDTLGKSKDGRSYIKKGAISASPEDIGKQTILDRIRSGRFGTLIPQQVFDIFDGGANFDGAFHAALYKSVNEAVSKEIDLVHASLDAADAKLKQLGMKWTDFNKRSTVAGRDLSRQDMMQIYVGWMNPSYREALSALYNITEADVATITSALKKKEIAFAHFILEDYAKSFPLIDKTLQNVSNRRLSYESKYTPKSWTGDEFAMRTFEEQLDMEATARDLSRKASPNAPFTKDRIGMPDGDVKLDLRLVDNWLKNVVKRSHYITHAELIKNLSTTFNDARVVEGLQRKFGQPAVEYVRDYIKGVANPDMFRGMRNWEKFSRVLRSNVASAYLALNPTSVAIQFTALPKYLRDAGLSHIAFSLVKFIKNPVKTYKRVCEWEPQIRDRYFEKEAAELGEMRSTTTGKAVDIQHKVGMWPTKLVDRVMVIVGYDAVYNRYLPKVGHEAAKAKAMEVTLRINSAIHPKDRAPMYKTNEAANWLLQFTDDLNKSWGEMTHTLPADIRHGRIREAAYTMTGFGLMAVIAWSIMHKDTPNSPEDLADAFTEQSLSSLPLIGNMAMAKKAGFEDSGNIALNLMSLPGELLSNKSATSKSKAAYESFAVLFGLPYTFTRKTANAIKEESLSPYMGKGRENPWEDDGGPKRYKSRQFLGRSRSHGGRKFLR